MLSVIWLIIVAFYLILPILIWIDTRAVRKATEATLVQQKAHNALTRQLLRAYGHEPEA